ncbi:MAG: peptide deformylase [Fimbriimonas ginsengisoli]|uniref:Peptide deformylase n=1 Tax=Fimbriimonas ginsengisoli TaxID=1005039 RepID=A0A931LTU8_FIMGI|nr:peptide deformylase [Fimbriimonas ginsengisoli]
MEKVAPVVPDEFKDLYVRDARHPIYKIPDPVLRKAAAPVPKVSKKTGLLADDLIRIMREANGVGLAAPQIGVLQRVIVISPDRKPTVLINPVVISATGSCVMQEGCLSLPGLYGDVERPETVEVEALDRRGRAFIYEMEGMAARVVQHEIDHLDGILFIDKAAPATLHWESPETNPDQNE